MMKKQQNQAFRSTIMICLGAFVGALAIPCALILLFIKSTGTLNTIALWLSPLFIVFAIISMIWLSAKYRLTLVFIAPFIFSVIIGFSAPDRSVIVKMLSDGLGHYSGPMGALVNPLFITALIAAGGCVYALNKIKNFMQARSIKIILTGVGVVYSIIVTAIAAIFMIGFTKTDWF